MLAHAAKSGAREIRIPPRQFIRQREEAFGDGVDRAALRPAGQFRGRGGDGPDEGVGVGSGECVGLLCGERLGGSDAE